MVGGFDRIASGVWHMSNQRGIILEIAGHSIAYASHGTAPATWATTVQAAIISIPAGSVLSVDYDTFRADTGGTDIALTDASASLNHFSTAQRDRLDGAVTKAATTITVDSTAGFSSTGFAWIGQEAIEYAGSTGTTFTGCSRAMLGTDAESHQDNSIVYSYAPSLLGRKCILRWYDLEDIAQQSTRYTGFIDGVDFGASGYSFQILSAKKRFEDSKALHPQQGKARLAFYVDVVNWIELEYAAGDLQGLFITLPASSANWPDWYIRIDNELIRYQKKHIINPAYQTTVATVISPYSVILNSALGFSAGRTIEFFTGATVNATASIISLAGATIEYNTSHVSSPGEDVRVLNVAKINGAERGVWGTKREIHTIGADVREYRGIQGNHVDILLWLMLSQDGDKANSDYDILPAGWGAGIDQGFVNITAFEKIAKPRATFRRYTLDKELDILDFMGQVSIATNTRMYWDVDGILTVKAIQDLYPLDSPATTIDDSIIQTGTIPQLRLDLSTVRNVWEWFSDYDLDGDHRALMRVEDTESRRLYGERPMPPMMDLGMRSAQHNGLSRIIAQMVLSMRNIPISVLTAEILFYDSISYTPGQLVTVDLAHVPNMRGSRGISSEVFEVLSYAPHEGSASATLVLIRRRTPTGLGHVSPVCLVESVASDDVTVRAQAFSHYAPASQSFIPPGNVSENGLEDVHWFLADDPVRFLDVSTLGAAIPVTGATVITSIDYGSRIVTVAAAPAFLASGDLMRLDLWSAVRLGLTSSYRADIFIALADDTFSELAGDPAYVWGI
jgi:hypothetical protein